MAEPTTVEVKVDAEGAKFALDELIERAEAAIAAFEQAKAIAQEADKARDAGLPNMPDVTKAQVTAIIGTVGGLTAALGLPLGESAQDALVGLVMVVPAVLIFADAAIRFGRSLIFSRK